VAQVLAASSAGTDSAEAPAAALRSCPARALATPGHPARPQLQSRGLWAAANARRRRSQAHREQALRISRAATPALALLCATPQLCAQVHGKLVGQGKQGQAECGKAIAAFGAKAAWCTVTRTTGSASSLYVCLAGVAWAPGKCARARTRPAAEAEWGVARHWAAR